MKHKKKSWTEKLYNSKDLPKVVKLNAEAQTHWKGKTLAIPSPIEVDSLMKKVPKGKVITINELRKTIAKKHKADIGCPLTTGIFTWIASYAAEEQRSEGMKRITPWWRTLKSGGELNSKYPGGVENQTKLLELEGHSIVIKGKKIRIQNLEKHLLKNLN